MNSSLSALAESFAMQAMGRQDLVKARADFQLATFAECERRRGVLARWQADGDDSGELLFVCDDPLALDAQQWFEPLIERMAPVRLSRVLVSAEDFAHFLNGAQESLRAMDSVPMAISGDGPGEAGGVLTLSMASIESTANATVRLVDSTLFDALRSGASDIHLEVQPRALQIKYRLDGVLQAMKRIDSVETAHQAISRIKVLADLDIAERRVPQDGRFRVVMDGREIDFRVSVMPNMVGEDAVLRVLDRKHLTGQFQSLSLDTLSFEPQVKGFIRRASHLPYGLLLVTGPTGSGKTTTLYAAISEINTGLDKIITIEDPIEYQLAGVLQIPVNEKKGLTFAKGLRSILRHDPDKIMVGEIRDSETAQISVQAALTGHQVFTTVHANSVFDVIGRFSNMGVDSYSLVAALTGIMAQRLIRTYCPQCKGSGCVNCRGTGYKGRMAIAETLPIGDEMKDLLVQRAPISTVKRLARANGFHSLRQSAVALAERGMTSLEEIDRVAPAQ